MAKKVFCDGCGAPEDGDAKFEGLGYVIVREYCPECVGTVRAYLQDLDDAHEHCAAEFERFKQKAMEACDIKVLPDVA